MDELLDTNLGEPPSASRDLSFCDNGGCPIVEFRGTEPGFALVGSSGLARKPLYILKEAQAGWHALAAVAGLGNAADLVPIQSNRRDVSVDQHLA